MDKEQIIFIIENCLLATGGLKFEDIENIFEGEDKPPSKAIIRSALEELEIRYKERGSISIGIAGEKYRFFSHPDAAKYIKKIIPRTKKLSNAECEVLAIIAYEQPIKRQKIEEIRGGVNSYPTISSLIDRRLVKANKTAEHGTPALYMTTDKFLEYFGINSLAELPIEMDQ